jgi:hypothetical protein
MFERDEETGNISVVGYTTPVNNDHFTETELRNAYLAQGIHESNLEDNDREKVDKFLFETTREPGSRETHSQSRGVFEHTVINSVEDETSVYAGKKYKPVAQKVKPVYQDLPEQYRIIREIKGDPLANMPRLTPHPPEFTPTGRYTEERKVKMDEVHGGDFLWPEERKVLHHLIMMQNEGFAWEDSEKGDSRKNISLQSRFLL